jgi:hypothetical protein
MSDEPAPVTSPPEQRAENLGRPTSPPEQRKLDEIPAGPAPETGRPASVTLHALTLIDELRRDAKIGKDKHFCASERTLAWHRYVGIPSILVNLALAASLSIEKGKDKERSLTEQELKQIEFELKEREQEDTAGPIALQESEVSFLPLYVFLGFLAASLGGIQTFFNFQKRSEGHRGIGNRYLHVSRRCKRLLVMHHDLPFDGPALWKEYDEIYADYKQINTEAEAFPTNRRDLARAQKAVEVSPFKHPS